MILAAGRGTRMRPLTERVAKPLLKIRNTTLIEHNLMQLKSAGIDEVVINVSYLADQIKQALGDGERYGVKIRYSDESAQLLGTGGGIRRALKILGDSPFLVISGDVWTDYPFEQLITKQTRGAHLVLVDNPSYHPLGDFALEGQYVARKEAEKYTFGCIGVFHPEMFLAHQEDVFPLSAVLDHAIDSGHVTGEHYSGVWFNVGTPEELLNVERFYQV